MDDDLIAMAREVLDTNRYLTLGTVDPDGSPRVSPVYFVHHRYRTFYWVSSPDAHHSANLEARPSVALVVFDSTVEVGGGRAVYATGAAALVPDDALERECARAFATAGLDGVSFSPDELSGPADLRLYVATAARLEVHVRGSDPVYGRGVDTRREVTL